MLRSNELFKPYTNSEQRGAKQGWAGVSASASLRAGAGRPIQADRISFFLVKVNVLQCPEFRSSSKNKVRQCEKMLVMF